jgi:hypothetical protein
MGISVPLLHMPVQCEWKPNGIAATHVVVCARASDGGAPPVSHEEACSSPSPNELRLQLGGNF